MPSRIRLPIEEGRIQLFWLTNPSTSIVCEKLLHHRPGQHWVTLAHWGEQIVVAKLFTNYTEAQVLLKSAHALTNVGVQTSTILYEGWTKEKTLYVILLEQLEAQNIHSVWQLADNAAKNLLLQKLIKLLAKLHQAGLQLKSLHLKNFLIKNEEICVEQLQDIEVSSVIQPLSELVSLKNLALLFAQLPLEWEEKSDQFYAFYIKERNFAYTLTSLGWFKKWITKYRHQHLRTANRELFKTGHHLIICKRWRRFSICEQSYDTEAMRNLLALPQELLNKPENGIASADDEGVMIFKTVIDGKTLIIKGYQPKNLWQILQQTLMGSYAMQCWRKAYQLQLLAQPTPKPLGLVEIRFGLLRFASYFIAECLPEKN